MFSTLKKAVKGTVNFTGDVVKVGVRAAAKVTAEAVAIPTEMIFGQNLVSDGARAANRVVGQISDAAIDKVAKPVAGAIATLPIRKVERTVNLVSGVGKVVFTDRKAEGLKQAGNAVLGLALTVVTVGLAGEYLDGDLIAGAGGEMLGAHAGDAAAGVAEAGTLHATAALADAGAVHATAALADAGAVHATGALVDVAAARTSDVVADMGSAHAYAAAAPVADQLGSAFASAAPDHVAAAHDAAATHLGHAVRFGERTDLEVLSALKAHPEHRMEFAQNLLDHLPDDASEDLAHRLREIENGDLTRAGSTLRDVEKLMGKAAYERHAASVRFGGTTV
ncbi:MAG TPA: hypothetical protein VF541_07870 [Longimicrobium sp.]|jgi:hypothetical protein